MKDKKKIAIYSGSIPSTTFVERLILALSKNGCEVYLFGLQKGKIKYNSNISSFAYRNSKVHKAWYLMKYTFLLLCFKANDKRKLDTILKSNSQYTLLDKVKCYPVLWHKPDVFHVQWAKGAEYWSWVQQFNIKYILSLRGAHINYSPIADEELADSYRRCFPRVDRFHAVSRAIKIEAQKYGAEPSKIDVVYSGLTVSDFENKMSPKSSCLNIVSVGRSHWIKGYHYALDACKVLKDRDVQFTYTIVGAKGYLELLYQIKDLGLENHVVLLDALPMEEVKKMIQKANLLLLPSVMEGIANVVLEAMASKTLVLSTNCGGMEEVIEHKVNGFICPIRDKDKMANCLEEISRLSDSERELMVNRALDTIENQHTEFEMVDNMIDLYKNVLNEG